MKKLSKGIVVLMFATAANAVEFVDVHTESGLVASVTANQPACGQAIADFNLDGWQDVFVTGFFDPNKLFINQGDGQFLLSDDSPSLSPVGANCGSVSSADYDNDGWMDLYMACDGDNYLFHNDQGQGFSNVISDLGLNHAARSEVVAWGDINADGKLDLFVGTYPLSSTPDISDPYNWDQLWLSQNDGSYLNISSLLDSATLSRTALAGTFTDIDLDGDLDLYVVNDKEDGNALWRNDGPGCGGWCFTDVAVATGAFRPVFGMGIAAGDFDHDGDFDLFFSSIGEQVILQNNLESGSLSFTEISTAAGINFDAVGWGTQFADFNNDTWLDAYLATGGTTAGVNTDRAFRNTGLLPLEDVSETCGASNALNSMGVEQLDYNRDGAQDLLVCNFGAEYSLYKNITPVQGNWLEVTLNAPQSNINRNAIGAKVFVTTPNGLTQMREVTSGQGRGGNSSLVQHFGLGDQTSASIRVVWPDQSESNPQLDSINQLVGLVLPASENVLLAGFE
ncbi:MAG: CRTAC1 family protein [bacterium]